MTVPEIVLRAEGISKTYVCWENPSARLRAPLFRAVARALQRVSAPAARRLEARAERISRPFAALKELSFDLRRGESLGIIGRNGSGKSTLLQLLTGTLSPTTGSTELGGRLAALLELGSGFNPEFSGRDNVFLQGTLYGISTKEMESRFDEIATFAEIGGFMEQPVKVYSSGMMVRLAFATQIVLRPDVFIVDEALAVGDVFFQAKCIRYFQEQLARGMSLILVSHDLSSIKALCSRALVLHQGEMMFLGESSRAVSVYHELHQSLARLDFKANGKRAGWSEAASARPRDEGAGPASGGEVRLPDGAMLRNWTSSDEIGSREAEIVYCQISDSEGTVRNHFVVDESFRITIFCRGREALPEVHFGFQLLDRHNRVVYGLTTLQAEIPGRSFAAEQLQACEVMVTRSLGAGDYLLDVVVGWGDRGDGAFVHQAHRIGGIASIAVRHVGLKPRYFGPADLKAEIRWKAGD